MSAQVNMVSSPITPQKPAVPSGGDNGSPAQSTTEGRSAKAKHQNTALEPSPASTYGETAVGDSVPATPQGDDLIGM